MLTLMRTWLDMETHAQSEPVGKVLHLTRDESDPQTCNLTCGERKTHWHQRRNGLRCHFKFVLRQAGDEPWRVVAYSFQVDRPAEAAPQPECPAYFRYDYTEGPHEDPVQEPWCHLTPGNDDLRLPAAPLTPKELVSWYLSLEPW